MNLRKLFRGKPQQGENGPTPMSIVKVEGFLYLPGDWLTREELRFPSRFWPAVAENISPRDETGVVVVNPVVFMFLEPVAMSAVGYQVNKMGRKLDEKGQNYVLQHDNIREALGVHLFKIYTAHYGPLQDRDGNIIIDDRNAEALAAFSDDVRDGVVELLGFVSTVEVMPAEAFEARLFGTEG